MIYEDPNDDPVGERDHMYSLLAMALVNADWQQNNTQNKRGHNICSVLVDNSSGEGVFYARNSNAQLQSSSQHGEVRAITNFLKCMGTSPYLSDYTLYTTLEPCIMCAGMLTMTKISKVVYVQRDPGYGKTMEIITAGNYPISYPEATVDNVFKRDLENKYASHPGMPITRWLLTDDAHNIYLAATNELAQRLNSKPRYAINAEVYDAIRTFMQHPHPERFKDDMAQQCPTRSFKPYY